MIRDREEKSCRLPNFGRFRSVWVLTLLLLLLSLLSYEPSLPPPLVRRGALNVRPRGATAPALPDGVAGVYVVYRRPKAFLSAALSFRTAYPEAPLYIICDSGCYDYRRVAAGLGAVFLGPLRLTIKNGRMFMSTEECMALFNVWRRVLAEVSEPYFMHIEDDVRVIQRVKSPLPWDINGAVDFAVMHPPVEAWIKARNPAPRGETLHGKLPLGGMGGAIFRSAFWREYLERPTLHEEVDSLIRATETKNIDAIVSALTYMVNGTVGFFDGYGAGWSPQMGARMYEGKLEVEHDYKLYYNYNLTAEDLEALGPGWDVPLEAP